MKAAFFKIRKKRFEIRDIEIPEATASESLVRVLSCGVCGTDLHEYKRNYGHFMVLKDIAALLMGRRKFRPYGLEELRLGHEICGVVQNNISGLGGKQVIAFPDIPCGKCWACQRGMETTCFKFCNIGFERPGGFAEYVAVPNSNIIEISEKVDPKVATLAEPLACSIHAIELAGVKKNDNVLVVGVGPIGLLITFICSKEYGSNVIACDTSPFRLQAALRMGAFRTLTQDELAGQNLFPDVAFDVTGGSSRVINRIIPIMRPRGTICVEGFYDAAQEVDLRTLQDKEARIVTSRGSETRNRLDGVLKIEQCSDELRPLITDFFALEEISEAFSAAANHTRSGSIKTVITFNA